MLLVLKPSPAYQYIPVIIYLGLVLHPRKEELLSMGAYKYIEKGETFSEIVRIAEELKQIAEAGVMKSNMGT